MDSQQYIVVLIGFKALIGQPDGDVKDGILAEYLGFCRTLDELRPAYKNDATPERWISVTIDVCLERGFLVSYLTEHRTEVQKIMLDMYDAEQVREFDRLMIECKAEIAFGRMAGMSESAIKDLLVSRHGFLEEYAQNLLDYEEDPNTVVLV